MRIVVATGDTDLRLAIQLMLSEEPGINIIGSASDSGGFIALIKSTNPDLALVDWDLPGCNNEDLVREVKAIKSETKLTLIVLGKRSTKETAVDAGADDYLIKGDPPDMLLDTFRQLNIS
jgi:DNA-binding NarL/FixJ family response regulator